jgi:hypothetical protein
MKSNNINKVKAIEFRPGMVHFGRCLEVGLLLHISDMFLEMVDMCRIQ